MIACDLAYWACLVLGVCVRVCVCVVCVCVCVCVSPSVLGLLSFRRVLKRRANMGDGHVKVCAVFSCDNSVIRSYLPTSYYQLLLSYLVLPGTLTTQLTCFTGTNGI